MAPRAAPRPTAPPDVALPGDVRLMNVVSGLVFAGVAGALLVAGAGRIARLPMFEIAAIEVWGDLARSSVPTIRANALPALAGNFFTIDMQQARRAFEQVPWVRHATVRRVWPNRLVVRLEEHQAAARWESAADDGGVERLVNVQGDLFDANLGDIEDDALPLFAGPEGSAPQMLALWRRLQSAFERRGLVIEKLALSGRGSWRVETDRAATIVLGRGSDDELLARTERFLRTLPQVRGRWPAPLEHADLRHPNGYALRLRGVTTGQPPAPAARAKN